MNALDDIQTRALQGDELSAEEERRLVVALGVQPGLKDQLARDEQLDGLLRMFGRCDSQTDDFVAKVLSQCDVPTAHEAVQPPEFRPPPVVPFRTESASVRRPVKSTRWRSSATISVLSISAALLLFSTALLISYSVNPDRNDRKKPRSRKFAQNPIEEKTAPTVKEQKKPAPVVAKSRKQPPVVAELIASKGCRWKGGRAPGSELRAGSLNLLAGTAVVKFGDGTLVSLQGPAEFELATTSRGSLQFGQLTAAVPKRAVGFTIETPIGVVVDLGTEFRVSVEEGGTTEVKVLKGRVEYRDRTPDGSTGKPLRLSAGESHRVQLLQPDSRSEGSEPKTQGKKPQPVFQGAAIINGKTYKFSSREEYEKFRQELQRQRKQKP